MPLEDFPQENGKPERMDALDARTRRALIIWLLVVMATVWGMVVIGGLTRLTESGLSIVHWSPLSGTLPPMNVEGWQAEFAHYQQSPQYQKINKGMTLEQFKGIYWLEYLHRLAGRAVGLLFFVPLVWFVVRHSLTRWLIWRLGAVFVLGGLQGALGWYMVKSGLIDVPMVSPFRLAAHLGMAFLILGILTWTVCQLRHAGQAIIKRSRLVAGFSLAVFAQVLLGALVAGLDAGLTYNTFPLMDGRWVPNGLYVMEPWYLNHFENVTMVQFQHRVGAYALTLYAALVLVWVFRHAPAMRSRAMLMAGVFVAQIALGVLTLVQHVPIVLASAHQAVAAVLFVISVWMWYDAGVVRQTRNADGAIGKIDITQGTPA